jgi:hypothetical protein
MRYLTETALHGIGHASATFPEMRGLRPPEMGWSFASRLLGRPLALGRRHNTLRGKEERRKERASARYAEQKNNHCGLLTRRCGLRIDLSFHHHWHIDSPVIGCTLRILSMRLRRVNQLNVFRPRDLSIGPPPHIRNTVGRINEVFHNIAGVRRYGAVGGASKIRAHSWRLAQLPRAGS